MGTKLNEAEIEHVGHLLSVLIEDTPVEVYAIALDLLRDKLNPLQKEIDEGVQAIARLAARNSLLDPPLELERWKAEMGIEFRDYAWFASYHHRCGIRLFQFLATEDLIKETGAGWVWYNTNCGVCPPTTAESLVVPVPTVQGILKYPATWWVDYWERIVPFTWEHPCEKSFEDEQIWGSTLRTLAGQCPTCYTVVREEYPRFRDKVVKKITDIIGDVSCIRLSTDLLTFI